MEPSALDDFRSPGSRARPASEFDRRSFCVPARRSRAGARHAAGRSQFCGARPRRRISENRRLSRAGPGGTSRRRADGIFYLGGPPAAPCAVFENLLTLVALAAYAGIVEDRPPIVRAALMAALYLSARLLLSPHGSAQYRGAVRTGDSRRAAFGNHGCEFSAVVFRRGNIGALAVPWIAKSSEPYLRGLEHLTGRNARRRPRAARNSISDRNARRCGHGFPRGFRDSRAAIGPRACWFRRSAQPFILWELMVISAILQLGMLPPMAYYFHRVTLAGPFANVPAVLLTGLPSRSDSSRWRFRSCLTRLAVFLAKILG